MAATTAGALKAFIEAQGLGISVYRDRAPQGVAPPYVTVAEGVAITPDELEDNAYDTGVEEAAVDLWMPWRDSTGAIAESLTLARDLVRKLQGASLPAAPTRVYGVMVRLVGPRLVDEEEKLVHVPISLEIWRQL